jgi:hypothetical protein
VDRALEAAHAVVIGEPIAKNALTVRLRVQSVWKGELGSEVVMSTGAEATSDGHIRASTCDVNFDIGRVYLVFGNGKTPATMKAHACSFTGPPDIQLVKLLDGLVQRRQPSMAVVVKPTVVVVGSVRNPGLVEWREGLTVEEAVKLAGGAVPPVRPDFAELGLTSQIIRWRATREVYPAAPKAVLLRDDELGVAGDMTRKRP